MQSRETGYEAFEVDNWSPGGLARWAQAITEVGPTASICAWMIFEACLYQVPSARMRGLRKGVPSLCRSCQPAVEDEGEVNRSLAQSQESMSS